MSRVDLRDLNWGQPPDPRDEDAIGTVWTPDAKVARQSEPDVKYSTGLLQALDLLIIFFREQKKREPKRIFVPENYEEVLLRETNARLPEDRKISSVKKLGEYEIVYFRLRPEFELDNISLFVR